eukprot:scaffold33269_cov63-Cyclotella_meneghiniana.AAC.1
MATSTRSRRSSEVPTALPDAEAPGSIDLVFVSNEPCTLRRQIASFVLVILAPGKIAELSKSARGR